MSDLCRACGEGHTTPMSYKDIYEYRGTAHEVTHYYKLCDTCGSELTDNIDSLKTTEEVRLIRKVVDREFDNA